LARSADDSIGLADAKRLLDSPYQGGKDTTKLSRDMSLPNAVAVAAAR
jgi:hypothetical protein